MECRICKSATIIECHLRDVPVQVSILFKEQNNAPKNKTVNIYKCMFCNHYQIEYLNALSYYDDYLMQVSYSKKINELQKKQINCLVGYSKRFDSFLEVGAGDGGFLKKAKKHYQYIVGYEPSKSFFDLCKESGLNVINDYFSNETSVSEKFDAFASRQVFEHLPNPIEVLKSIHECLDNDGVGLIEVPNGEKIFKEGRYFEIISDHVNYYTMESLIKLIKACGFKVLELKEDFGGDYLVAYIKKEKVFESLTQIKKKDYELIEQISKLEKVIVWGGGAKAFNFMNMLNDDANIIAYIDGDKYKEGLFLPNASKCIELPSDKILEANLVVIFASSYEDEIIEILKRMGYTKQIFSFITKSYHDV